MHRASFGTLLQDIKKTGGPWWGAFIKGLENQEAVVLLNISTTTVYFDVK